MSLTTPTITGARLTTMLFFADDPWLGNDAIGADRPDLTVDIDRTGPIAQATFDITVTTTPGSRARARR